MSTRYPANYLQTPIPLIGGDKGKLLDDVVTWTNTIQKLNDGLIGANDAFRSLGLDYEQPYRILPYDLTPPFPQWYAPYYYHNGYNGGNMNPELTPAWPHPPGWKPGDPLPNWNPEDKDAKERNYDPKGGDDDEPYDGDDVEVTPGDADGNGDGDGDGNEPPDAWDVVITNTPKGIGSGSKGIQAIKIIRSYSIPVLGLKEAKDLYDRSKNYDGDDGYEIMCGLDRPTADRMRRELIEKANVGCVIRPCNKQNEGGDPPKPKLPKPPPDYVDPFLVSDEIHEAMALLHSIQGHLNGLVGQKDIGEFESLGGQYDTEDLRDEAIPAMNKALSALADKLDMLEQKYDDTPDPEPEPAPKLPEKDWEYRVDLEGGAVYGYGRAGCDVEAFMPGLDLKDLGVFNRRTGEDWTRVNLVTFDGKTSRLHIPQPEVKEG